MRGSERYDTLYATYVVQFTSDNIVNHCYKEHNLEYSNTELFAFVGIALSVAAAHSFADRLSGMLEYTEHLIN